MKIVSYIFLAGFLFFSFLGCESNAEPIVYDKTYDTIKNEIKLIHYLIRIRNFSEADNQLNKQLVLYPDNNDLLLLKAWLRLQEYRFDESKEIFDKLAETQSANPKNRKNNPMICAGLARIARLNDDPETAEEYVRKGLKESKLLPVLWTELGFIQFGKAEYSSAESSFGKAALLDRSNTDAAFYRYISMLYSGKDIDDIKQHWLSVTKSENCRSIFYLEHAKCLYDIGHRNLCKVILKEGLERYRANIYLNNFYAYFLYEEYIAQTANSDSKDESTKITTLSKPVNTSEVTDTTDDIASDEHQALLDEALSHIEICFRNESHVEPEFVDTYLHILECKNDTNKINEVLDTYYLFFPTSPELIPWLKKYRS